jgi:hypothetical protein
MTYIVLDLDNCIADDSWRRPLIRHTAKNHHAKYHAYHQMGKNDPLGNTHLFSRTPHEIVICTSRPEQYRKMTERWLSENGIVAKAVLMRLTDDHGPSPEVKRRLMFGYMILRERDRGRCVMAYDDRADIVAMYHTIGLKAQRAFIHDDDERIDP